MSLSPDRSSQPAKPAASKPPAEAVQKPTDPAQPAMSEPISSEPMPPEPTPLVPKRPLMRPVNRPQPPVESVSVSKSVPASTPTRPPASGSFALGSSAVSPSAVSPSAVSPTVPASTPAQSQPASIAATPEASADLGTRQQPISPPSEPKQYRAIGLLRGRYTATDEQFTRGELKTTDGTAIEAVLLGRVMSLVRNHLNLEQDHLWVVYPRTREAQQDLHVQIVGVWEPEKLQKPDADDPETSDAAVAVIVPDTEPPLSPGYEDDYFSIRGEVVFYAPERSSVIVKIQQTPRKGSDKAKMFKLQLSGDLATDKALGYFWDFQVKRQDSLLVIKNATSIGLIPPKRKDKNAPPSDRRFSGRRPGGREGASRGARSGSPTPVRREALPKPAKRADKLSEG